MSMEGTFTRKSCLPTLDVLKGYWHYRGYTILYPTRQVAILNKAEMPTPKAVVEKAGGDITRVARTSD